MIPAGRRCTAGCRNNPSAPVARRPVVATSSWFRGVCASTRAASTRTASSGSPAGGRPARSDWPVGWPPGPAALRCAPAGFHHAGPAPAPGRTAGLDKPAIPAPPWRARCRAFAVADHANQRHFRLRHAFARLVEGAGPVLEGFACIREHFSKGFRCPLVVADPGGTGCRHWACQIPATGPGGVSAGCGHGAGPPPCRLRSGMWQSRQLAPLDPGGWP